MTIEDKKAIKAYLQDLYIEQWLSIVKSNHEEVNEYLEETNKHIQELREKLKKEIDEEEKKESKNNDTTNKQH